MTPSAGPGPAEKYDPVSGPGADMASRTGRGCTVQPLSPPPASAASPGRTAGAGGADRKGRGGGERVDRGSGRMLYDRYTKGPLVNIKQLQKTPLALRKQVEPTVLR